MCSRRAPTAAATRRATRTARLDAARRSSRSAPFVAPALGGADLTRDFGFFVAPALGGADLTRDFGFVPVVRIGNFVWHDANGDGLQNEPFANNLANVLVQLRSADDSTLLGEQRTNVDGAYEFNSLTTAGVEPNTAYTLAVPLDEAVNPALAPFVPTLTEAGGDTAVDSDGTFERKNSPSAGALQRAHGRVWLVCRDD